MFQMDQHQMKKWGNPARNLKHSATQRFSSQSFEAVGTVIESADPSFEPGQIVIAHGMGLGVDRDGGLACFVRADASWLVPLPSGLSPLEAATIGVAGFSAALAVDRLESMGVEPGFGPIAVTGATGGVGCQAVGMLARLGYEVVAVTSKPDSRGFFKTLGASEVIAPPGPSDRMLDKGMWAGAVDTVGSDVLAWLLRSARPEAIIASIGNAGGNRLPTSVIPFILRGITLTGINGNSPPTLRRRIWERLGTDLKMRRIASLARVIEPDEIDDVMVQMVAGRTQGRAVVAFCGA
ncbi:zinc-binding dehydrogenase [Pseudosulfitobacter pseudonitzschiae]|uniref:zinc-binding dehydrogenase n=2 Tax=Pseudosulfitobacter pseudonitzschiae TaxID=1402135 RepID=UPI001AF9AA5B|nr:zinc-binding dehydrogenase [Pseudosulfitobacter pseudonitzschiae]MBM1817325.1 zinc-binding dehydrogenase [Pseudosulfitobacter pseudonitzschiae]MBM1834336.1 zinc-binding dehydrogenase [Pseudosulfitobacter pseudonitzschiae]MBM1839201.1 zinc-binding dehydrogenase [Pseudosulfitobacter pseudonitzschiae]MBM1844050.1 zinc-binding dehydrogenase [Pseudosulfitobacter pseudonitzschiae]MBM1848886.1 zinc-binding dehydrogenase [Pseudosulfitobacter pseudonitzschiae]